MIINFFVKFHTLLLHTNQKSTTNTHTLNNYYISSLYTIFSIQQISFQHYFRTFSTSLLYLSVYKYIYCSISHIKSMYERKKYLKKTLVSAIYSCCSLPHHILTKLLLECKLYKVLQNKTNSQHNTATQYNLHSFLYFIIRQKIRRRKITASSFEISKVSLVCFSRDSIPLIFPKTTTPTTKSR